MNDAPPADGAAPARRTRLPRLIAHTLGLVAAAALSYLVFRAYRQPGLVIDLLNAFTLC